MHSMPPFQCPLSHLLGLHRHSLPISSHMHPPLLLPSKQPQAVYAILRYSAMVATAALRLHLSASPHSCSHQGIRVHHTSLSSSSKCHSILLKPDSSPQLSPSISKGLHPVMLVGCTLMATMALQTWSPC